MTTEACEELFGEEVGFKSLLKNWHSSGYLLGSNFLSTTKDLRDISGGVPDWVFEKFLSFFSLSFPFSLFLFFLFLFFSLFLGGPFSSGAPGHCPHKPPTRYATALKSDHEFSGVWGKT